MVRRKQPNTEPPQEVELTERYGVLLMPEAAVEVTVQAKVYHEGKLIDVQRTFGMKEIQESFKELDEIPYIPPDAVFTLTELGKRGLPNGTALDTLGEVRDLKREMREAEADPAVSGDEVDALDEQFNAKARRVREEIAAARASFDPLRRG